MSAPEDEDVSLFSPRECTLLGALATERLAHQATKERLREVEADAARLDWIEAEARGDDHIKIGFAPDGKDYDEWNNRVVHFPPTFWVRAEDHQYEQHSFTTLRAAIDAARGTTP